MGLGAELTEVERLHAAGRLTDAEFALAKAHLVSGEATARVERTVMTLVRAIEERRRRLAIALLVLSVPLWLACAAATGSWMSARQRAAALPDEPLAEVLGVQIPDPRPAVERAELRLRALVSGAVAFGSGLGGLTLTGAALLTRPPRRGG